MKKVVLIGVPHHNNLGDHAITIAERKYIEDNFKEYQYYEISEETLERCIDRVKKYICDDDILFFHGGGNLGDEYLYIEEGRRKVVQLFPNNTIIFFPQTMHFSNTEKGEKELEKSRRIYSKHKKLLIIARENVSYQIMKKEFPNNKIIQTPDIVTYLDESDKEESIREGVLIILRNDIEANLSNEQIDNINSIAEKYFSKVEISDTARGEGITEKHRKSKIQEMLDKYKNSQLVITDRLHGMIFAAITSTPCISLGNYNHKIKACSEVLEHLGYIQYVDNIDEIEEKIEYLLSTKFEKYNNDFSITQFEQISKEVFESEN